MAPQELRGSRAAEMRPCCCGIMLSAQQVAAGYRLVSRHSSSARALKLLHSSLSFFPASTSGSTTCVALPGPTLLHNEAQPQLKTRGQGSDPGQNAYIPARNQDLLHHRLGLNCVTTAFYPSTRCQINEPFFLE